MNDGLRQRLSDEMKGQVVEELLWDEEGNYWVMTFATGQELVFRLMADL